MAAHCDFWATVLDTPHRPLKDTFSSYFWHAHLIFQGKSPLPRPIKVHVLVVFEPLPIRKGCLHPGTKDISSLHQHSMSHSYTYYWP